MGNAIEVPIRNSAGSYTVAWLMTHSTLSHYGIPVLRMDDNSPHDYRRDDIVPNADLLAAFGEQQTAGDIVKEWLKRESLSESEREAGRLFLSSQ